MTLHIEANLPLAQIRHTHDLDHQRRPAGEMLCSLSLAGIRVILLPCESCLLPVLVYVFDEIETELDVQEFGGFGVGAGELRVFLNLGLVKMLKERMVFVAENGTYEKLLNGEVVDVNPDWTTPVILFCAVEFVFLTQASKTVVTP